MGRAVTSGHINGAKVIQDSRMDIEGIGMTTSQVMNRQNNNFMGQNNLNYQNYSSVNTVNQQNSQHYQGLNQNQNSRQENYQQNQFQNRLQQNQQHFQQQQPTSSRQAPN